MFCNTIFRCAKNLYGCKFTSQLNAESLNQFRRIHTTLLNNCEDQKNKIAVRSSFENIEQKNKNTYLEMLKIYEDRSSIYRRGHVEFIYSALKNMESFGVIKDLEVYKALIDVLPKGKFIPKNILQAEFMHYPKQQQCIIDLLQQMEDNGVMPDYEVEDILLNIFGRKGFPLRKFWRMMYWMPKFKNLSPWHLPSALPEDILELAKLAIARIASVDIQAKLSVYQTKDIVDAIDDTWIVSSQSATQKFLLEKHSKEKPIYVEGSFKVWIKDKTVNYFILRTDPKPPVLENIVDFDDVSHIQVPLFNITPPTHKQLIEVPTVHEQEDGTIFALCATGTSSRDSLLSWIRHLERDGNSALTDIPVVFTLRSPEQGIEPIELNVKSQC